MKKLIVVLVSGYCFSVQAVTLWQKYPIQFFDSMAHSSKFNRRDAEKNSTWIELKRLYDKGMKTEYTIKVGKAKIPEIYHLIWLGSPPPPRYAAITKQLKAMHPGCKVKLWTDTEAKKYKMINRLAFNAATNFGEKSDILRYEILFNEGGVYVDGDFVILKSFKDFFYVSSFFAGMAYDEKIHLYNGLIGSTPKHPIIKLCIETLGKTGPKNDPNAIMNRTGPHHFTRCFLKAASKSPGVTIPFPCPYFYPWPNYDRFNKNEANIKRWYKPYSFAVHLWACSWVK